MSLRSTCIDPLIRCLLLGVVALCSGLAWGQSVEKALMPGQVVEGHVKIEQECTQCHKRFDKTAQSQLCLDCHKDISRDVTSKTRLHGHLENATCRSCHAEHKGRKAIIAPIDKKAFDHGKTEFRLNGAHKAPPIQCESCHKSGAKFREAPRLCNDCHKKLDQEKGHKGSLGVRCESCHNETNWKEAKFDHEKTRFSLLNGKHAEVKCKACHADKTFQNTPLNCIGCHKQLDEEKGHKGRYGVKCESCHNDKGWKETIFNHDADTRYVLKGKHKAAKCNACHLPEKGPLYQQQKLPSACVSCHRKDDQERGHRGTLGEKCETCHSESDWKTSRFDHDTTRFALRDKHKDAKCESCHKGGVSGPNVKLKLDRQCVACHRKDDDEKGHKGRFGDQCETCHTTKGWKASIFNHDRQTKYPLKASHAELKCDACHTAERGQVFKSRLDSECISCHKKDDKHKGQLGNKCESCHNEKRWQDAQYDHNKSRFVLTGSHAKVECKKCHLTPAFRDTPSTCNGCHEKDDKHKGRFGTQCESCHYTGTWKSWDFDHSKTRFALDGGHKTTPCYSCHKEPVIGQTALSRACVSCHLKDDVHEGGFSSQCERCHVTSDWKRVRK